jgi:tol-pal system protein YbgF
MSTRPVRFPVSIMQKFLTSTATAAVLLGIGLVSPVMAQDASEMAVRMQQLEEQVRQLTGQVQELSFEVKQLRAQGGDVTQKSGAAQPLQPAVPRAQAQSAPTQAKRLAAASAGAPLPDSNGVEVVDQQPLADASASAAPAPAPVAPMPDAPADGSEPSISSLTASAATLSTANAGRNAAAKAGDGGFQGKVLVPPSQEEPGADVTTQDLNGGAQAQLNTGDAVETVSLQPDAATDTPESLYEQANESLLRRQFGDAEAGFSTFLQKYPDHSLAGSAQYWLGETYYAQGDFKRAAQSFLKGYKSYPKSRRAADSLLKLGLSLGKLGQADQACAAYAAVSSEYPKSVDARKRAQAESKRAGCAS